MKKYLQVLWILLPVAVFWLCLGFGSVIYSPVDALHLLGGYLSAQDSTGDGFILAQLRAPRIAVAMLAGLSLAVSGAALQGLLRNPLADPYIVGTSSGAALGASIALLFTFGGGLFERFSVPIFAFCGAALAMMVVFVMATKRGNLNVETFLLAGVIVGAFCGAMVSFLMSLSGKDLHRIVWWLMGSISGREDWSYVWLMLPYVAAGFFMLHYSAPALNLLSIGEEIAFSRGVDIRKTKIIIIVFTALLTGATVAVVGTIGFLGFMIPHLVRSLFGGEHKKLIMLSAVFGACFLALADTLVRCLASELPVGVITALCGAPFFLLVLRKRNM